MISSVAVLLDIPVMITFYMKWLKFCARKC